MALWVGIHPRNDQTRVLAMAGADEPVLKARLRRSPQHHRALPTLLEALALWEGAPVRAALAVDGPADSYDTSLCGLFGDVADTPLFSLEMVEWLPDGPRRRDDLAGLGDFRDLRRLLLREVAR